MKKDTLSLININSKLAVPVYKQIVQSICKGIDDGLILQNDKLPSVNGIAEKFSLARGSVFSAYNDLRASGLIDSIPGKGYFVTSTQTKQRQSVLILFNTFSADNEILYNSIQQHLSPGTRLDVFFHHHDRVQFETLIREKASYYNALIIVPEVYKDVLAVFENTDPKQIFILDKGYKEFRKTYPGIYQNLEKDIVSILTKQQQLLKKYKRLFLHVPGTNPSKEIVDGFKKFAKTELISTDLVHSVQLKDLKKGDAFIVIDNDQLVELVQCIRSSGLVIGKEIGILSYHESNLKSLIGDGISTITPDYVAMGRTMANMIASNERKVIENPFIMIDRGSF